MREGHHHREFVPVEGDTEPTKGEKQARKPSVGKKLTKTLLAAGMVAGELAAGGAATQQKAEAGEKLQIAGQLLGQGIGAIERNAESARQVNSQNRQIQSNENISTRQINANININESQQATQRQQNQNYHTEQLDRNEIDRERVRAEQERALIEAQVRLSQTAAEKNSVIGSQIVRDEKGNFVGFAASAKKQGKGETAAWHREIRENGKKFMIGVNAKGESYKMDLGPE